MSLSINEIVHLICAGEQHPSLWKTAVIYYQTLAVDSDAADENGHTPIFFIPDLHILSENRGIGYGQGKYFHLNQNRKEILKAFLSRLIELRDEGQEFRRLKVYQLGDMNDLWREARHWWGEDVVEMLERQIGDHEDLFWLFRKLGTERLAGNHDNKLRIPKVRTQVAESPVNEFLPMDMLHPDTRSFRWGSGCRMDMIHADQVDDSETPWYRKMINPVGSRFAARDDGLINIGEINEWSHEVRPEGPGDDCFREPTVDYEGEDDDRKSVEFVRSIYDYETCAPDATAEMREARRVAVMIGHTHRPRIVRGDPAHDYTMIDCGSWVNTSFLDVKPKDLAENNAFWNAQVGVLCGNEAALLQIGTESAK
jgi:UDP-2,3-diacylglucosamine pyrophosphatase LpxH